MSQGKPTRIVRQSTVARRWRAEQKAKRRELTGELAPSAALVVQEALFAIRTAPPGKIEGEQALGEKARWAVVSAWGSVEYVRPLVVTERWSAA
jgi:hypothetical protein